MKEDKEKYSKLKRGSSEVHQKIRFTTSWSLKQHKKETTIDTSP